MASSSFQNFLTDQSHFFHDGTICFSLILSCFQGWGHERFSNIKEIFPDEINDDMLFHFCDWLSEKVFFMEIEAKQERDAQKIFVSINDRGLKLSSAEMLKGYLLSEIKDDQKREELNELWKETVFSLTKDENNGEENFIKSWFRAQYAKTIRGKKAGDEPQDYELIGGAFHEWVRNNKKEIKLNTSDEFESFIRRFSKFAEYYRVIREAEKKFSKEETEYIYYNAQIEFTMQTQLLLAPICDEDDLTAVKKKMNFVARFIELYIINRVINNKSVKSETVKDYIFRLTKEIRRCSLEELKKRLMSQESIKYEPDEALHNFQLNNYTKRYIKHILARIIGYIEESTDKSTNYIDYMNRKTKNPFEIEHIITDHYDGIFKGEYADQEEFKRWRNNIGALLLIRKKLNASLKDSPYEDKLSKYSTDGDIYAKSLGEQAYRNAPEFKKFISDNKLKFKPYSQFGKDEIRERNHLFVQLFKLIWNTDRFCENTDNSKSIIEKYPIKEKNRNSKSKNRQK